MDHSGNATGRVRRGTEPPKKKRQRPSPKAKSPPTTTSIRTAWDRLDVDRQAEVAAVADRIIIGSSSTSTSTSTNADAEDQGGEGESSSSSSWWRALAVRELRLGVILDSTQLPERYLEKDVLCEWLAALVWQTQQARKVFALLDTHNKGCIVAQDLLNGDLDGALDEDAAVEMMDEFRVSGGGDDDDSAVMTEDDLIRVARLVNLS